MSDTAMPSDPRPAGASVARHIDAARLFEASARRFAGRTALVCGDANCTYAALLDRTGRIAAGLREMGIGHGERVVLMVPNSIAFIEAWWGIVRAGAVVVPINPRATGNELMKVLLGAGASALVVGGPAFVENVGAVMKRLPMLRIVCADRDAPADAIDIDRLIAMSSALASADPQPLDAPCAMYFTAGSTGEPKGVLRSHQSVVWGLAMLARKLAPGAVLLARAPMAHTGGSLTGPFAALIAGGTLVLPPATTVQAVLETAAAHRVTHLYVHPTVFAKGMLARLAAAPVDLSSLERLQWTAGPLPEPVRDALLARFPTLPLEVTFGMTEASNIATYEYRPGARDRTKAANCVGYPLPGAELRIANSDGESVPDGSEGEVVIRTPTAFDRYWQDPAATELAFTPDGWLRTGDIGFLDEDGALHLNGRQREIIKTGGMTVHPAEVEQALAEHPQVVDAIVFGQAHQDWDEAVVAVVCLRAVHQGENAATESELVAHCRIRLASYKLPKTLHVMTDLPRNASGKIDKQRVIALLATPTTEAA